MLCTPPAQGKDPALTAPGGTHHEPRKRQAPARAAPGGPTVQGSTAASWGCSSSQGFNPGQCSYRCCCPLARALHENPSFSPSWAHSPPSSNAPGWGRCFTVVLWEFPSWLNPCRGHPEGIVPAMVGQGAAAVPDCRLLVPSAPSSVPSAAPCPYSLGARAGPRAPTSSQEGLHCPIPCKHSAPSLPRDSPWAYSGELPFFWLIMSKYRSERRKRGYESFSMSP